MRMIDVPIKNQELLDILDEWVWFYDNREDVEKYIKLKGSNQDMSKWTCEEHRDAIVMEGVQHEGYPECLRGYTLEAHKILNHNLRREFIVDYQNEGDEAETRANEFILKAAKKYSEINQKLGNLLVMKNNALAALYPPEGFISWHNNANASAYNFIFTWSETGDGCFKYIDADTGEEVILQDRKGWNCKAGYFGSYEEHQSSICYHAAETKCWRLTLGYMLDRSSFALGMQEDIIAEISGDF